MPPKVRPDTLQAIKQRRESMEPDAWDQLFELASKIRDEEFLSKAEAWQSAIDKRPDLYQEWQDAAAESRKKSELIEAACAAARDELSEDATYDEVWQEAREAAPWAFKD